MIEATADRYVAAGASGGDLAEAGRLIRQAIELMMAIREMAGAAGDLMPDTTDSDRPRAVLQGQAALCASALELVHSAADRVQHPAHRPHLATDASRPQPAHGCTTGRAAL